MNKNKIENITSLSNAETDEVDKMMKDVNARIGNLSKVSDIDNILKKVIPNLNGETSIKKQLDKFLNKK